jgi:hypothetical protein
MSFQIKYRQRELLAGLSARFQEIEKPALQPPE